MSEWIQANVDLIASYPVLAALVVFLVATGEALLIVGLFVPSTVFLVTAGAMVGMGKLGFAPIFLATLLGAILGDTLSYWIGRIWKDDIRTVWPFTRYGWLFTQGEAYFEKHGGKSVFVARFLPGMKAIVPGIAGMAGMDPVRFTLINVLSAIAWTVVHLLPAMGLGRGIDVASTGNPRLLILLAIVIFLTALTYYAAKVAYTLLVPYAERTGHALARKLPDDQRWLQRLLTNHGGLFTSFAYAGFALLAVLGFAMLAVNLLLDPDLARSDTAISEFLQEMRTETFDRIMIGVSMSADSVVLVTIAIALAIGLLVYRQRRLAAASILAFIIAMVFVPLTKGLVQRIRPQSYYDGVDAFSFPSGHATLSTTVLGISVLILTHQLPWRWRHATYLVAAVLVGLVAFSRVYLQAHWPSDVFAGVLAGSALTFAMALVLHHRPLAMPGRRLGLIVAACALVTFGVHVAYNWQSELRRYAEKESVLLLTNKAWREQAPGSFTDRRILLRGNKGESILLQTNLSTIDLTRALRSGSWQPLESGWADGLLSAVLPWKGRILEQPTLPLTNNGRRPLEVLVRPMDQSTAARYVLRVWQTGQQLSDGNRAQILALSVTQESVLSLPFGYRLAEQGDISNAEQMNLREQVIALLGSTADPGAPPNGQSAEPWVIPRVREPSDNDTPRNAHNGKD